MADPLYSAGRGSKSSMVCIFRLFGFAYSCFSEVVLDISSTLSFRFLGAFHVQGKDVQGTSSVISLTGMFG